MVGKAQKNQQSLRSRRASKPAHRSTAPAPTPKSMDGSESLMPIVGVGASAGGLEAFAQLLEALPNDPGIALVLVQHLDPTHESSLTSILAKTSPLPVLQAEDGQPVEPNHVYVIPPNKDIAILHGKLSLMPRSDSTAPHFPIDYLFRSLADDRQSQAVGVVLSGTGTDGTLGLRAIKAEGGLAFAQNAETAKYDGMPLSAINSGVVDFILSPAEMAVELARLVRHPYMTVAHPTQSADLLFGSESDLSKILIHLRMDTGVDFAMYKPTTIHRRIRRRMALHRIESYGIYLRYVREHSEELRSLFQDLLINVTGFFRDPEMFDVLQQQILPHALDNRSPSDPFRVWVPGCSTGEEAYSFAIVLLEILGNRYADRAIQIFATDVNDAAIAQARMAVYPQSIMADVSPERLKRFFVPVERGYQVSKTVRQMCLFSRQDLNRDPPFSKLDLVSCRNVMIYMGTALQQQIIPAFHFALNPGGILVLGQSDSIGPFDDLFGALDSKHRIYAKKATATPQVRAFAVQSRTNQAPVPQPLPPTPAIRAEAERAADRLALARYAPAGVLVNDNLDVVQFRGHTGTYLDPVPGTANLNVLKLARPGLSLALRSALDEARHARGGVRKTGVGYQADGQWRAVNLEVVPIAPTRASPETYFLILFEVADSASKAKNGKTKASKTKSSRDIGDQHMAQLQEELAVTKAYLESVIEQQARTNEELVAASEEIQSSNEELQSSNEELETSKEELQATNEELTTVNEELQHRNQDLGIANDDLVNLLTSVNLSIVILDSDLRIRRTTPAAEQGLGLIPADIGRSIDDIKLHIEIPNLDALLRQVMDTLAVREQEVQDRAGRWYLLRVRPYKTLENRIDGVVLVFLDIHGSRSARNELQRARDYAQAIVETIREPLMVLDGELCVQTANRSFYQLFQMNPAETESHFLFDLADKQWDLPPLRELLEKILPTNSQFEGFVVEAEFPRVGHRKLILNARRIRQGGDQSPLILLAMEPASA